MDAAAITTEFPPEAQCRRAHPDCFACAPQHPFGLKVAFVRRGSHRVEGSFPCGWHYQGYPGRLHGGVVSTLLDSAMVHALMVEGVEAFTADLRVRFRAPVLLGVPARITGLRLQGRGPLHHMTATLEQEGQVKATAQARFFEIRNSLPEA